MILDFGSRAKGGSDNNLVIIGNGILSSATILSPLKVDPSSLHLYKTNFRPVNELDYILKRSGVRTADETPDSKERRSQMGSSFIRFGRNHMANNGENIEYSLNTVNDLDASSRIPRGRSDVIIRFGRSGSGKLDSMILRNNKLLKVIPIEIFCADILAGDNSPELTRLCNSFMSNDDKNE
ncbi:Similar to EAG_11727: FMRFamide-related peptides (Camponotus floridanus) [Cotesia congregata]|uniref:Similar to EAG_11727: FMRFamide-related peptides (Camponotus floridanus) n=1 Tax=Cotesia congregata TaxID=51543 RepID=A0A8J2H6A4_COTCN|nr:Similar to EAG_11727: FMRFamide-related peptides (Camponotus floridanus) [Cotesia congregata]